MFCKKCGDKLKEDARFCGNCGSSMPLQEVNTNNEQGERNRWYSQYVFRNISAEQAEKHVKNAWIAGIVSLVVTTIFVLLKLVDAAIWLDVILIAVMTFGVYRKSSVSAVCLFVYFFVSKIVQLYESGANASGIILGLVFLNYFYLGILGTLKLKSLLKTQGENTHKRDIALGTLAGVTITFIIFITIGYLLPEENGVTSSRGQFQNKNTLSNAEVVERLKPAIVYIETKEGSGSGMIFDDAGYILTNAHVVSGFKKAEVKLSSGGSFSGDVVGRDEKLDLAVLKINGRDLKSVQLGDSDSVVQGDEVFTFGYPFGLEGDVSFKEGTISRRLDNEGVTYLETSAEIHPGNSGGALVNKNGEVIGVNTAIFGNKIEGITLGETIKLALPINDAKGILEDLKNGRNVVNAKIIPFKDFIENNLPSKPANQPPAPVKIPTPSPPPVISCNGNLNDLQQVVEGTYEMGYSNSVTIKGVLKNNSACIADQIKLKIYVRDASNTALVQEETVTLFKNNFDYLHPSLQLNPSSTGEYSATFTIFETFTQGVYSYGVKTGTELKQGVKIQTQVISAKWLPTE